MVRWTPLPFTFLLLSLSATVGGLAAFSTSRSTTRSSRNNNNRATTSTVTQQQADGGARKTEEFASAVSTSTRFSTKTWLSRPGHPVSKKNRCRPCPTTTDDENDDTESNYDTDLLLVEKLLRGVATTTTTTTTSDDEDPSSSLLWRHPIIMATASQHQGNHQKDPNHHHNTLDRREAAFAMLGTLWATTTTSAIGWSLFAAQPAYAVSGTEAKIQLPNMLEGMADRASKQCLVESLGTRECLVYMDEENQLYRGADTQKLLLKLDASSIALTKIEPLVRDKKWSSVKSLLTGPMGELLVTMNQLAPLSTQQPERSVTLAKQVKLQVFAISAAADKKDGTGVLKSTQAATDALVAFVQSL